MKFKRTHFVIGVCTLSLLGFGGVWLAWQLKGREISLGSTEQNTLSAPSAAPALQPGALQGGASSVAKQQSTPENFLAQFPYRDQLREYADIKKQVLPSEALKEKMKAMLRDEQLLAGLKGIFQLAAANNSQVQELQNQAIDLLLEARASTRSREAEKSLLSVVEDTAVEDDQISLDARKFLAGIKAEVLFKWSAQEPEISPALQQALPGQVSRKIWRNVIAAQKQNQLESLSALPR